MKAVIFFLFYIFSINYSYSQTPNTASNSSIILFKNDTLRIKANFNNGKLIDYSVTSHPNEIANVITFDFRLEKIETGNSAFLKIWNSFDKNLQYKAKIKIDANHGYIETDVNTVLPKLSSYEIWPYDIESIMLYDFELK